MTSNDDEREWRKKNKACGMEWNFAQEGKKGMDGCIEFYRKEKDVE